MVRALQTEISLAPGSKFKITAARGDFVVVITWLMSKGLGAIVACKSHGVPMCFKQILDKTKRKYWII